MSPASLATHVATWCVASSLAAVALAEPLTIDQAQELARKTGRPILAVAGSKT
jgi:hypothetical protein